MQELIIDALRPKLEALPFVTRFGGLAQVLRTTDTGGVAKRLPITADSQPLTPDSKGGGLLYFEHQRLNTVLERTALAVDSTMLLVFWGDLTAYDDTSAAAALAQAALIAALPQGMYGHGPLFKMTHVASRIMLPQDGLFDKYTYNEAQTQYLLKPYTAFAVEVKTACNIPLTCLPQPS